VINVTDVGHLTSDSDEGEDKMRRRRLKKAKPLKRSLIFILRYFSRILKKLNIKNRVVWSKATDHIKNR
jgi:cysteinyl-tRNA synthetase